jgi:hypothetical protein
MATGCRKAYVGGKWCRVSRRWRSIDSGPRPSLFCDSNKDRGAVLLYWFTCLYFFIWSIVRGSHGPQSSAPCQKQTRFQCSCANLATVLRYHGSDRPKCDRRNVGFCFRCVRFFPEFCNLLSGGGVDRLRLFDLRADGGIGGLERRRWARGGASGRANERELSEETAKRSPPIGPRLYNPSREEAATMQPF